MSTRKAVTVRIPAEHLRMLMKARKARTQSQLINDLLEEEVQRLRSHRVLAASAGKIRR